MIIRAVNAHESVESVASIAYVMITNVNDQQKSYALNNIAYENVLTDEHISLILYKLVDNNQLQQAHNLAKLVAGSRPEISDELKETIKMLPQISSNNAENQAGLLKKMKEKLFSQEEFVVNIDERIQRYKIEKAKKQILKHFT